MILFLDTAIGATTIAIKKDNKIFKKVINDNINISQHLVSCVNDILKSANSKKTDIKLLCFNKGPGNFTSLRVSLAFIKAIAYYLNVPVLELNSFQVLAISTLEINYNSPFVVAVDAKMNEVYFSEYKNYNELLLKDDCFDLLSNQDFLKKCHDQKYSNSKLVMSSTDIISDEGKQVIINEVKEIKVENIFKVIENNNLLKKSNINDVSILYLRNKVAKKKNE